MTLGDRNRDRVEAVKAVASFAEVAESLGVEWERDGSGRLKARCLWHEERTPSLKAKEGEAHAYCYGACGRGYDVIALVQQVRGGAFPEALAYLEDRYGIAAAAVEQGFRDGREQRKAKPKPKAADSPKRIKRIGETARWTIRDADGEYVAEHVRIEHELEDGTREKEVIWKRQDKKGLGGLPLAEIPLYRAHLAKDWPSDALVVLTEGEKAADALVAAGYEYVVATACGSSTSPSAEQLEVLRGFGVTIWRDADAPGVKHARKLAEGLGGITTETLVYVSGEEGSGDDAADHPAVISTDPEAVAELLDELRHAPLAQEALPEPEPESNVRRLHMVPGSSGAGPSAASIPVRHRTDVGNAQRLAALHGHEIRYVDKWSKFLVYDGARWAEDDTRQVERWAKRDVPVLILDEAKRLEDEERKKHLSWAIACEENRKIKAMIEQLKSEPGIAIRHDELDGDPWLLNVANGTLDLRTGDLRPHDPSDLLAKLAPVEYDPDAQAPTWEAFLEQILPSEALRRFVQRLVGYALNGVTREHKLPIFHGAGANGKSTLLNAVLEVAGDYGLQAADDLLIAKGDTHPTERADLFGRRVVTNIESQEGRRFNESLVKQLTGGDKVRARRMREDFWEFAPTHTLLMATNHKPEVRGTDHAIWRRIRLVPFEVAFDEKDQDKSLPEKFRAELPGILAWAVRGHAEWMRHGLGEPAEVALATAGYRSEMDVLAAYLEDCCVLHPAAQAGATPLYQRYVEWCEESREKPLSQRRFGASLGERGFESRRRTAGEGKGRLEWVGIGLSHDGEGPPDTPPGGERSARENGTGERTVAETSAESADPGTDDARNGSPSRDAVNERETFVHQPESAQTRGKLADTHTMGERSERESGLIGCLPAREGVNRKLGSLGSLGSPGGSSGGSAAEASGNNSRNSLLGGSVAESSDAPSPRREEHVETAPSCETTPPSTDLSELQRRAAEALERRRRERGEG